MKGILETYMQQEGSRDLVGLLSGLAEHTTWKTAPRVHDINEYFGLLTGIVTLVPECILGARKLADAILACHQDKPCLMTHLPIELEGKRLSGIIRALLGKLRLLKDDWNKRRCFLKKALWH